MNPLAKDRLIILLRHGVAEERSDDGSDESRALTPEGQKKMKENAQGLARLLGAVDCIVSSPLVRCVQTALFVAKAVSLKQNVVTDDALRPASDVDAVRALIERTAGRTIILVGHEPLLTQSASSLTGFEGSFELKKGGCYVLHWRDDRFELDAVISPRLLRHVRA